LLTSEVLLVGGLLV